MIAKTPRKLIVTPRAIHKELPRDQRNSPTVTVGWDESAKSVAVLAQTLPKTRNANRLLDEMMAACRTASTASVFLGFAYAVENSIANSRLGELSLFPMPKLQEWRSYPSDAYQSEGRRVAQSVLAPELWYAFVPDSGKERPIPHVFAAPGFDPASFGVPYIYLRLEHGRVPKWALKYTGEGARDRAFGSDDVEPVELDQIWALNELVETVLDGDPEVNMALAVMSNPEEFARARASHEYEMKCREIVADFARPKDRIRPRVTNDVLCDIFPMFGDEKCSHMRTHQIWGHESATVYSDGRKMTTVHAAMRVNFLGGFDCDTHSESEVIGKVNDALAVKKLGAVVRVTPGQGDESFWVVRNLDLFRKHVEFFCGAGAVADWA